jgi:Flp pilus assembly protein TadG
MRKLAHKLRAGEGGAAAIEFALILPALVMLVVGIAQLGILFMANAGLRNAVAEGARYATIYPRPTDTQIRQRITASRFGLNQANVVSPTITYGVSAGTNYADISMSYSVRMNFVFFTLPPVTLTETRRAFIQPAT